MAINWRIEDVLSEFGGPVTDVIESSSDELFVSTLNRGFFRVKLLTGSSQVFDRANVVSLATAKDAPQISESDALTQFNGEPAFLSKDGIARYEIAENRFVPIAAFAIAFPRLHSQQSDRWRRRRPTPLDRADRSQHAGRKRSENEDRANQFGRSNFFSASRDYQNHRRSVDDRIRAHFRLADPLGRRHLWNCAESTRAKN